MNNYIQEGSYVLVSSDMSDYLKEKGFDTKFNEYSGRIGILSGENIKVKDDIYLSQVDNFMVPTDMIEEFDINKARSFNENFRLVSKITYNNMILPSTIREFCCMTCDDILGCLQYKQLSIVNLKRAIKEIYNLPVF